MKNNTISDDKIAFNKQQSKINKDSQVSCCLWGGQDDDNCSENIISAHSIQRGKILESIAENGKVLYLTLNTTNDLTEINPTFKLEGIKKFSTFFGLCGKHDKDIFQPIEDKIFNGDEDQLNRYAYRAVCKELHAQMVSLKKNKLLLGNDINGKCPLHFLFYQNIEPGEVIVPDFIRELINKEIIMEELRKRIKGIELNIQELSMLENHLKSIIKNQNNSLIEHRLYTFDYTIPIACSSVFFQYKDPLGKVILSENDTKILSDGISDCKQTTLNIFPENGKTYVIFSVIGTNDKVIKFIDDLFLDEDNFNYKLSHIILNHVENIAFKPSYIDGFSDDEKNEILKMFFHNLNTPLSYHKSSISLFRKTINQI